MTPKLASALAAALVLFGPAASAHRVDEYLQATIVSLTPDHLEATMRLIPGALLAASVIAAIDSNRDDAFSDTEDEAYTGQVLGDLSITVDGAKVAPKLLSWRFPPPSAMREGVGEIEIRYTADLPHAPPHRVLTLADHHREADSVYLMNVAMPRDGTIRIGAQTRNSTQSIYELEYEQDDPAAAPLLPGPGAPAWPSRFEVSALFRLGMRHIAEGTDHVLFLLALLLPAPLLAVGTRWRRAASLRQSTLHVVGIVTAFTAGHSITLGLAAMGVVQVPGRPVEVLIALSILVSAAHALRPLFPGREAGVAATFGLVHGLAFAATLDRLGLRGWDRLAGILAFNLGIEAMQMLIVCATLPSLLLLSRTPAYPILRIGGAVFAGAASLGWIVERLLDVRTPLEAMVDGLAGQAPWVAFGLLVVSIVWTALLKPEVRQA